MFSFSFVCRFMPAVFHQNQTCVPTELYSSNYINACGPICHHGRILRQTDSVMKKHIFCFNKIFILFFQSCKESCLAFNQRRDCKCMEYRFPRPSRSTPICNILNKETGEFVPKTAFSENSNFVHRRNLETNYTG